MKSLPELRRRLRGEEAQRQRLQRENQSLREQSRRLQREKKRLEQESQSLREECRRLQGRIEEIEREAARQAAPFRRRENRKVPPDKRKKPGRKGGHKGRSRPVPDHVHGDAARLALSLVSKHDPAGASPN